VGWVGLGVLTGQLPTTAERVNGARRRQLGKRRFATPLLVTALIEHQRRAPTQGGRATR